MASEADALNWLRVARNDPEAEFRDGQWPAIDQLVNSRGRVLCVQRTGWGKSMVYFVSAKLMRDAGLGPTLIISPLLALMRNQIDAANRLGLRAESIDSTNTSDWAATRGRLLSDQLDLLLISPERLANDEFISSTLLPIAGRIGLLVIDEAHCISDWGHDFRPDYRRIGQILRRLPGNIAVLATTATANTRVVADVQSQLGGNVQLLRGPLMRDTLALQVLRLPNPAERLAWLADHVPSLPGSGIVYTLTQRDATRVAEWLNQNGINSAAYFSGVMADGFADSNLYRQHLEARLLNNDLKCLVATTALGMGYDKPDLGFVIHYQTPGSVVFYYQQVGRAGRAIDRAFGVLLSGDEEADINEYFRENAFPPEWQVKRILEALENDLGGGMSERELEHAVNLRKGQIEKVLKLLVVEQRAPIVKIGSRWSRTALPFALDRERISHLTTQREEEWAQMQSYIAEQGCLMQFLAAALDDDMAAPCGKCVNCLSQPVVATSISREKLISAQRFVKQSEMSFSLKKQWDITALPTFASQFGWSKANIPDQLRGEDGRVLGRWGEPVWGKLVSEGKAAGNFHDDLVAAAVELIQQRWQPSPIPAWVTCIPSRRHPELVVNFARRLAVTLGLPFHAVISKSRDTEEQKGMENRYHQCHNLDGAFSISAGGVDMSGPVLLVDDVVDSAWTLTLAAALLRQAGSGPVFPFALATTTPN